MSQSAMHGWGEPCSLSVAGQSYEVLSVEGTEAVSELFRFDVSCRCPARAPEIDRLVGQTVRLELRDGFGSSRPIVGIVSEVSIAASDEAHAELRFVVQPDAFRLTLGRDSRVFQDATVVDIVKDVLGRAAVEARWAVTETYGTRVYTAQYQESDWQFVSRLLEEEGIFYWFDHEEGESRLVLDDRSTDAPGLVGGEAIDYLTEAGARQAGKERIERFGDACAVSPSKFTVRSFDPERPALRVEGSSGEGLREWYEAPGAGVSEPDHAAHRARLRREQARAAADTRSGDGPTVRIVPGRMLEVVGHPLARLDGRYFVTGSRLRIAQRRAGNTSAVERPVMCTFDCVPETTVYRPPVDTPPARQPGLQTAQVVGPPGEEIHPDATARVRVQQRWDRQGSWDDKAGRWCRVVQRGTAESLLFPRMGWNVLTMSEEGSVDLPVVISRIFDGEHPPTYALPDNKTRVTFRTATSPGGGSFNEVHFEDSAGGQKLFMNASKDMQVLVKNNKSETVHNDVTRFVGVNYSADVGNNTSENVVGNQDTAIGANEEESVGASFMKLIGADEWMTIGGLRKLYVGLTESTQVFTVRRLMVGGALIDISLGDIGMTAPIHNVLVGGAMVKSTVKSLTESVGGMGSYQTIGGAKFELCAKNRTNTVTGAYAETVGGAMTAKTKIYSDKSDSKLTYTVAASLQAKAPEIVVEGSASIEVKCGGSSIVVKPSEVTITASAFDQSGGNIKATAGGGIKVN